jgi:uncharacterized OsmC-like protein
VCLRALSSPTAKKGVELVIELRGALLSEAQRARLLRAAAGCPVKRMMSGGMRDGIATSLADAEEEART